MAQGADIVIAGGGVAGVYCAWRLSHAHPDWRIVVLERTGALGGRLVSRPSPSGVTEQGVALEYGGMRYFASQPRITALVRRLALPVATIVEQTPANVVCVRGVSTTVADLPRIAASLYRLGVTERGASPDAIVGRVLAMHARQRWDTTFVDAMHALGVTDEALQLYEGASGYSFQFDDIAARTAATEHGAAVGEQTQQMVVGGFQRVPTTLARLCGSNVAIACGVAVDAICDGGTVVTAGGAHYQARRAIVLAVPNDAAWAILNRSALVDATMRDALLNSSLPWDAIKLWVQFDRAWWSPAWRGKNTSDLGTRQVWLGFAPLVALVYAGDRDARLWRAMLPDDGDADRWTTITRLPALRARLIADLALMFGVDVPAIRPVRVSWLYWSGAAWFWRAGDVPARHAALVGGVPAATVPVHLTCSTYSLDWQGWVEGALQSADVAVDRILSSS